MTAAVDGESLRVDFSLAIVQTVGVDPLSDVLRLTGVTAHVTAGITGNGPWAVAFDAPTGVKFNAVMRGRCGVRVGDATVTVSEGDCFLLPARLPFLLFTDPAAIVRPASEIFAGVTGAVPAHVGEPSDVPEVSVLGGHFDFTSRADALLLQRLPPLVYLPAAKPESRPVRALVEAIDRELHDPAPGSDVIAESLATAMLARVLRTHLRDAAAPTSGWLAGLRDPVVAQAISAIHQSPERRWTVAGLASRAAVSRSTLAARFTHAVGSGPLEYLTAWRMEVAADRLRRTDEPLAAIAKAVGYGSESALSVAFKRVMGMPPDAFRRQAITSARHR